MCTVVIVGLQQCCYESGGEQGKLRGVYESLFDLYTRRPLYFLCILTGSILVSTINKHYYYVTICKTICEGVISMYPSRISDYS